MHRPKKGFDIPLGSYIRNELNEYLISKIEYGKQNFSNILDFDEIEKVFNDHNQFKAENPNLIWNVASFFAWHEYHIK